MLLNFTLKNLPSRSRGVKYICLCVESIHDLQKYLNTLSYRQLHFHWTLIVLVYIKLWLNSLKLLFIIILILQPDRRIARNLHINKEIAPKM